MQPSSNKFIRAVLAVTLICAGAQAAWNLYAPAAYIISNGYLLLGIFSLSITAIHLFLIRSAKGEGQAFIRSYMGSTVFKFMFYILLLVVLLLFSTDNKVALILHFLFYYAVFTVLEVSFLYTELQKLKK